MTVAVRTATPDDAPTLATLNAFVQALHVARHPDVFKAADHAEVSAWMRSRLGADDAVAWIAHRGGAAVGYLLALRMEKDETPFLRRLRWLELDQIAVDPDHRRRGIARTLIRRALDHARDAGLDAQATTWTFNQDASAMFHALGFTPRMVRHERGQ